MRTVGIVGLGYVGITLATALAEVGYRIHGVEIQERALATLRSGRPHLYEPGLDAAYARHFGQGLTVDRSLPDEPLDAYVICVGTPMTSEGPEMRYAIAAVEDVARRMRDESLVVMRSTVPVGFTRQTVLPRLLARVASPLLAFCPERTIQGRALVELRELPQIIGGNDERSADAADLLFAPLAPRRVRVGDLETAEIVKLVCNAHTDLIYGYGNEVARIAEALGLDAWEIIRAANLEYPRPDLSKPGYVGGPCLSKDPYILEHSLQGAGYRPDLVLQARRLNEQMPVHEIDRVLERLGHDHELDASTVFLCGIAYKGRPETDDLRGSPALAMIRRLSGRVRELRAFDAVLADDVLRELGVRPCSLEDGFTGATAVIFVSDHPAHEVIDVPTLAQRMRTPGVIFDSWSRLRAVQGNLPAGITYVALGLGE